MTSIIVERVIHDGERAYKIIDFVDFLRYSNLPSEYTKGCPTMFRGDTCDGERKFIKVYAENSSTSGNYYVGQVLTPQEFERLVQAMKVCGARLAEINERIRHVAKDWVGKTIEVVI